MQIYISVYTVIIKYKAVNSDGLFKEKLSCMFLHCNICTSYRSVSVLYEEEITWKCIKDVILNHFIFY